MNYEEKDYNYERFHNNYQHEEEASTQFLILGSIHGQSKIMNSSVLYLEVNILLLTSECRK